MRLPNLLATRAAAWRRSSFSTSPKASRSASRPLRWPPSCDGRTSGPAEIGAFVGSFYLPWAFKWAFGPFIDVFASERLGRRRGWIIVTQVLMALTLMSTVLLKLPEQLALFTIILLVHNTFGAMQDVAIDALAVNSLGEQERGLANGLMFAGAAIGQAIGGAGVLFLSTYTGFQPTFFFVAACILAVTLFVALPMREAPSAARAIAAGVSRWSHAAGQMRDFAVESFRSFLGTRGAYRRAGVRAAADRARCASGWRCSRTWRSNSASNDGEVAKLNFWSGIVQADVHGDRRLAVGPLRPPPHAVRCTSR